MTSIVSDKKNLKPGWKIWRFDQMATNVNVRVDDPSESGVEHYVGLEHLDADSLMIRRWGTPDDVEATKLIFKKGDIIFGRRRAYQRKLGVAEFDGICSAHAMVLRAKPDVVLPEFLPFFMQSDLFMKRAVEISVGSLSPTINWKALAEQEFTLPPIEEQEQLTRIFSRIEKVADQYWELSNAAERAMQALAFEQLKVKGLDPFRGFAGEVPAGCTLSQGGDLFTPQSGNGEPEQLDDDGDCLFLKVSDFNLNDEMNIVSGGSKFAVRASPALKIFGPGTVVFPKRGASIFLNKVGILRTKAALDPNLMAVSIKNPDEVSPEYIYWLLKAIGLHRISDVTSVPQLNHKHLTPLYFALPDIDARRVAVSSLSEIRSAWRNSIRRRADALKLKAQIVAELFQ